MPRTDLTSAFVTAMQSDSRSPRQLIVFHFPEAGDIYISDQVLGASDGLSNEYTALVEDWGTILDMAGGNPKDHRAGEIRQHTITLWNGGDNPFSNYFLQENPENVLVDIYQWDASLSESDMALIDTFVLQDPIAFDERTSLLRLDMVSVLMRYDKPIGDILTLSDWPNAKISDVGKDIPIVIGSPGEIKTLAAKVPAAATLSGSILTGTMTIAANENLDDAGFPSSGTIKIDTEQMRYSSRTSSIFTIIQRAYLSATSEHISQAQIIQVITDQTHLVSKGPINNISNIKVNGFPNLANVTIDASADPARLIFSEAPYAEQFAASLTFLNMRFDAINSDNTADQAHHAFDAESAGTAALASEDSRKLSIKQTTINPDRGEIVKAFLIIEHYESSNNLLNDLATVTIDGIGQVGVLSRPSTTENVVIDAEVDIDHGHDHNISNEHTHNFIDPRIDTTDPEHSHNFTGASSGEFGTSSAYPLNYLSTQAFYNQLEFIGLPGSYDSFIITLNASLTNWFGSAWIEVNGVKLSGTSGTFQVQVGPGTGPIRKVTVVGYTMEERYPGYWAKTASGVVNLYSVTAQVVSNSDVAQNLTGVNATIGAPGESVKTTGNQEDDVDDLVTANIPLKINQAKQATRTIANTFDLTNQVNFDWGWFTNRSVAIEYTGSLDDQKIYILNVFFDIEYRKREIIYSDEVTCEAEGIIDNGSGTYTGTPGAVIKRPDHVRKYVLASCGALPTSYIDSSSFAAAGSLYAAKAYYFNGVLDGSLTVRDAEKKLSHQCRSRFFWNAGKAKIKLRDFLADLDVDKVMTANDFRLKSFSAERQNVADLVNKISLGYDRDWLESNSRLSAYKQSTNGSDLKSISKNGIRENRNGFLFDMVTAQEMADDLSDFYLENLANASTFYEFETCLKNFDLEKEDVLSLTSNFGGLKKARSVIRAIDRAFGSGKLNKINILRITVEVVKYILLQKTISDVINVAENIAFDLGFDLDLSELLPISDDIFIIEGRILTDELTVYDLISILATWDSTIDESLTIAETSTFDLDISLSDLVIFRDNEDITFPRGFGSEGFGFIFGGRPRIGATVGDSLGMSDVLSMAYNTLLIDDQIIDDTIIFSDGFGGSDLTAGFGGTHFGS